MAAYVQYAAVLVNARHALAHLLLEHIEFPIGCHRRILAGYDIIDTVVALV